MSLALPEPTTYQVCGWLKKETEKAVCITVETVDDEPIFPVADHWFPKSQIVDTVMADDPQDMDSFVMKAWIMEQRGLIK